MRERVQGAVVKARGRVVLWRVRSFDHVAFLTLVVGGAALVGRVRSDVVLPTAVYHAVEYALVLATIVETGLRYLYAPVRRTFRQNNRDVLAFSAVYWLIFAVVRVGGFPLGGMGWLLVTIALLARNLYVVGKVVARLNRLSGFLARIVMHPAQTIALSFVAVITIGTGALMTPFAVAPGHAPLSLLDALFTATSAVCVTGLIVVDTATAFSVAGQLMILTLIQIGGLGFMILSFFAVFLFRRRVTVEDRKLLSYMLSEQNLSSIRRAVRNIVVLTLTIEAIGAMLLYPFLTGASEVPWRRLLFALFHSISAFCNAGFALFSDSLESFVGSSVVNAVIAVLIVAGGLSFGVITNALPAAARRVAGNRLGTAHVRLSVNSKAVLSVTAVLVVSGTLLFYLFEHGRVLAPLAVGAQYRAALFQSITLRTAGFNTVSLSGLADSTYLIMIGFMFIGGAAGSTAGGIKVNTVAVIIAALRQRRRGTRRAMLFEHSVGESQVSAAYSVLVFGLVAVGCGAVVLSSTENAPLVHVLFETVSAFGTVGLSAGLTPDLTVPGRLMVIVLMFVGRVGPLTLFAAIGGRGEPVRVEYPEADILVG